jgi:hypothetical protein
VEAKRFAPQGIRPCEALPVEHQFQLFVRLLESLGTPLVELSRSLRPQPADTVVKSSIDTWSADIVSSFEFFGANWEDLIFQGCGMHLNARLENDREPGSSAFRICMIMGEMDAGQLSFKYQFQRQGHERKWKKLEEGSTEDDVWEFIGRALEDGCHSDWYSQMVPYYGGRGSQR